MMASPWRRAGSSGYCRLRPGAWRRSSGCASPRLDQRRGHVPVRGRHAGGRAAPLGVRRDVRLLRHRGAGRRPRWQAGPGGDRLGPGERLLQPARLRLLHPCADRRQGHAVARSHGTSRRASRTACWSTSSRCRWPSRSIRARASSRPGIYDAEYYVEVLLDEDDPVRFEGLPSGACTYAIEEDSEHPIYYGLVNPLTIVLSCETS